MKHDHPQIALPASGCAGAQLGNAERTTGGSGRTLVPVTGHLYELTGHLENSHTGANQDANRLLGLATLEGLPGIRKRRQ